MGDAGPPLPALGGDVTIIQREVTVLVTGFGPFKTFHHNPSHLITTQLPPVLLPQTNSKSSQPSINLIIHPTPLRVSYPTISTTIPRLLSSQTAEIDCILHLGMAAGRRHYALETLAHRDGYTIKDVDNCDGVDVGSRRWSEEGCPSILEVGWDGGDVLGRWREELRSDSGAKETQIPDVRLSSDAGRFLCDFIFYESLSLRWKEGRERQRQRQTRSSPLEIPIPDADPPTPTPTPTTDPTPRHDNHTSQEGKVAFLHVPGDTDAAAIDRGVRVTIAAIRALVESWEEGFRRQGKISKRRSGGEMVDKEMKSGMGSSGQGVEFMS